MEHFLLKLLIYIPQSFTEYQITKSYIPNLSEETKMKPQ